MHIYAYALENSCSLNGYFPYAMKLEASVIILACIATKIIHDPTITKCIYEIWLADLLSLCSL